MKKKRAPQAQPLPAKNAYHTLLCCVILVVATFVVFMPSLNNGFTNWDDDKYITTNPDITAIDAAHIKKIATTTYVGNYQPLTMVTYMAEYALFGLSPGPYHGVSVVLHIVCCLLVFFLLFVLCKNRWAALCAALLFAVHPLRVESVAWAAEQKDVLCGIFFILSLLLYLRFIDSKKWLWYGLSITSFLLALASKPMAISLPFVLFLLDYLLQRKFIVKTIIEKVPYGIAALVWGIVTMFMQKHGGVAMDYSDFPVWQRICIPFYGMVWYIVKTLFPLHLSALYNFLVHMDALTTIIYCSAPLAVIAGATAIFAGRRTPRAIRFGLLWYIITLLPVLQIVRAGDAITADRYTYLPIIGLCFLVAYGLTRFHWHRMSIGMRRGVFAGIVLIISIYGVSANQRTLVWSNSFTLWNNVIEHFPNTVMAWYNRGMAYLDIQEPGLAVADFSQAVALNPQYVPPYTNRGIAFGMLGDIPKAIDDFKTASRLSPETFEPYLNMGIAYIKTGQFDGAVFALTSALRINRTSAPAYMNRGIAFASMGQLKRALADFDTSLIIEPDYREAQNNRGIALRMLQGQCIKQ
jgi:protein O-mannosyl-transferase